ncbi:hypothetical protein F5Y15DRAFT_424347 [Xylariaceae sp. FL0016]|nr:hypothetical protein F5Y15DRAFT_424347 [Xylariaceae sp. FL0016]
MELTSARSAGELEISPHPPQHQRHHFSAKSRDQAVLSMPSPPCSVHPRTGVPDLLASSLSAENGNATPQPSSERDQMASETATSAFDAQPPSSTLDLVAANRHPDLQAACTSVHATSGGIEQGRANVGQAPYFCVTPSAGTVSHLAAWPGMIAMSPHDHVSSFSATKKDRDPGREWTAQRRIMMGASSNSSLLRRGWDNCNLDGLPNEILMIILGFLDVCDLLATSRINHHFRNLSVTPILHTYRLRRARIALPPLLNSPSRPTLAELIARHIFLTHTTQISRRLARNLVAIRLSRRLPQRPAAETLVQRGVLPPECVPGCSGVTAPLAPGLVAKKRAVEKEKLKDGLRRWVGGVWRGEVRERGEGVRLWEERAGVGRVWRLRRFWERVGKGDEVRRVR